MSHKRIDLKKFCSEVGLQYVKEETVEYGYFDGMAVMSISKYEPDIYYYHDISMATEVVHFMNTKSVFDAMFNYQFLKEEISSLIERYKEASIKFKLKKLEKDFV